MTFKDFFQDARSKGGERKRKSNRDKEMVKDKIIGDGSKKDANTVTNAVDSGRKRQRRDHSRQEQKPFSDNNADNVQRSDRPKQRHRNRQNNNDNGNDKTNSNGSANDNNKRDNKKFNDDSRRNNNNNNNSRPNNNERNNNNNSRPNNNERHNIRSNNNNYGHSNNGGRFDRPRSKRPTPEALELSKTLQELSRDKKLQQALDLYFNSANIVDSHHACIMVDCCARCGNVQQAEHVVDLLRSRRHDVNIFTYTALLKAYSLAGNMTKAIKLFRELCNNKYDKPNVRTLNTVLRGCLWTAVSIDRSSNDRDVKKQMDNRNNKRHYRRNDDKNTADESKTSGLVGGVASSEEAWALFIKHVGKDQIDASSYEYTINLLCQAQRTDEAIERINEMQERFGVKVKGKASFTIVDGYDASIMETVAMAYLYLARALAMRDANSQWSACQKALNAAQRFSAYLTEQATQEAAAPINPEPPVALSKSAMKRERAKQQAAVAKGGKRAWKHGEQKDDGMREVSNSTFREHRMTEIVAEVKELIKLRHADDNTHGEKDQHDRLMRYADKCFYFSGGSGAIEEEKVTSDGMTAVTTKAKAEQPQSKKQKTAIDRAISDADSDTLYAMLSCWISFGYYNTVRGYTYDESELNIEDALRQIELLPAIVKQKQMLTAGQTLKLNHVFNANDTTEARPLDIELGAGFGDWIVQQAKACPNRNHIAVEVRADRLHSIFTKAVLFARPTSNADKNVNNEHKDQSNLALVGDNAVDFLSKRVLPNSVSTIYVNHPEPPTQTFGGGDNAVIDGIAYGSGDEPQHMLSSATIVAATKCLKKDSDGQLIIVTDNRWYAKLICATVVKATNMCRDVVLQSLTGRDMPDGSYRVVERSITIASIATPIVFQGQPGVAIRHADNGSSYFDRLWKTGISTHAERTQRYILVLRRVK